jgi:flavin-dependent dehydrogenase
VDVDSCFDVVVVGAGPAGAAIARRLALGGCRVALIERSNFEAHRVGESLAPSVQPLLRDLGVWPAFLALEHLPSYGTRSIWGSQAAREHTHVMTPYLQGWHVDRVAFDHMLAQSAARAGAWLMTNLRVQGCRLHRGRFLINLEGPNGDARISTVSLIDATGRSAVLARRLGARRAVFDRLVGIAVLLEDRSAGEHRYTMVEAARDGWWYCAPVSCDRSVAMLMTDGDLVRAQDWRVAGGWRRALQLAPAMRGRTEHGHPLSHPQMYPAVSQRLVRAAGDRSLWLAVGDAALAVDPISGSGVVRALRTAQDAAACMAAALAGDHAAIDGYECRRDEECAAYLEERAAYYSMEQRWPAATFWRRRYPVGKG